MKTIVLKAQTKEDKAKVLEAFAKMGVDFDSKLVCNYSNKGNLKGFDVYEIGHKSLKYRFDLISGNVAKYYRGKEVK